MTAATSSAMTMRKVFIPFVCYGAETYAAKDYCPSPSM
jgi:hypothetical protein